jgi:predicted amino acid-binding ACT domain protein
MKIWEFVKVEGSCIKVDKWLSETMGLEDGGCVYSTLFKFPNKGPKMYELILSMFPQENYRTLVRMTMYLKDVPGSSAQGAKFLKSRGVNILNSISLDGISDTIIVWKMMADLSFAGEGDMIKEKLAELKAANDPSVSLIDHISIRPADIGRVFHTETSDGEEKIDVQRGAPITLENGGFDTSIEYSDSLGNIDKTNVLVTLDPDTWITSVTFFRPGTRLVKIGFEIPDCPGAMSDVLAILAEKNLDLISVFSRLKIAYQTMGLELVADISQSMIDVDWLRNELPAILDDLNGIFKLTECTELD